MSSHEEDDEDRCERGEEEFAVLGGDHAHDLTAFHDALVPGTALDLLVPGLHHRWPEPRVLWQDEVWWTRERCRLEIDAASQDDLRWLIDTIVDYAPVLHLAAARDEELTTSSGLRRTMAAAGIPMIRDLDCRVWVESTVLVRSLRVRCP